MSQRSLLVLLVVGLFLALVGWSLRSHHPAPLPSPQLAPALSPGNPPRVVTVSQPLRREVPDCEDFLGWTEPSESVEVHARLTGTLSKIHCKTGAAVKKGDPLCDLDPRPFQAALDKARAELEHCEKQHQQTAATYARIDRERTAGKINQKEYDQVRTNLERDERGLYEARTSLAQAQLNRDLTQVTSPVHGLVELAVSVGSPVTADSTILAKIVATDPMNVRFPVDEPALLRLRERFLPGSSKVAGTPLLLGLAGEEGFPHRGTVTLVESRPEPTTGAITVRGSFANADHGLSPGRRVWIRLPLGKPFQALLVSEDAVVMEGEQHFLVVVNDRGVVNYRPVRLGPLVDNLRVVREGISATDRIVVTAVQRVHRGDTVTAHEEPMPVPRCPFHKFAASLW